MRLADASAVVVKAGPRAEMAAEAWACRRLTVLGMPVPAVAALDLDVGLGDLPTLILGFVAGSPSASPEVAFQTGRWFRRVHAEQLPGWGPLTIQGEAGALARGAFDSWPEAVYAELSGLPELVDAGVIDAPLATAARSCVLSAELLGYAGPGVLLHRDLKPAHMFGADDDSGGERLTAVIDWGDARVGDPLGDIARLSMAGTAITEAFLAGYERRLTDDLGDRLARYRILWDVSALSYEHRAGGDWFDVYRQRLRADVRRVSA